MPRDSGTARPRNEKDILAGCVLIAVAAITLATAAKLPFGRLGELGPGFFPVVSAGLLAVIGAGLLVWRGGKPGEDAGNVNWRACLVVAGSLCAFALIARPFGLLPACAVLFWTSGMAAAGVRYGELAWIGAAFALICAVVFKYGFGLPLPLLAWPGAGQI